MLTISIVSHGQYELIKYLLQDIKQYCIKDCYRFNIILTLNIPEKLPENWNTFDFPITVINNQKPYGFGFNHNQAFKQSDSPYFCVLNPDIRLINNPFFDLIKSFEHKNITQKIGVIAPLIKDDRHTIQDNARRFLTMSELFKRVIQKFIFLKNVFQEDLQQKSHDWIAGMCMVFSRKSYEAVKGFDTRYFLYCEDMDICARLKLQDYTIYLDPTIEVIHLAQKQSHKSLRYFIWHISSLIRFLYRYYFKYKLHIKQNLN